MDVAGTESSLLWAERDRALRALTAREREVLALVAAGLRNREIADRLCISLRTVHRHLDSIYDRLGVSSRTAAVARVLGMYVA